MNEQSPHSAGSAGTLGKRPSERSRSLGWDEVDRVLEVRSRVVVAIDELGIGDVATCELVLVDLLLDLDDAERIVGRRAAA